MITAARLRQDIKPAGLDWITSLRAPQIQALAEGGPLQLSLFDERDLAEITAPDYPGERLIVCRNPDLARERARKREDLLTATERDLSRIAAQVRRRHAPLRGTAEIGLAVGAVINRHRRVAGGISPPALSDPSVRLSPHSAPIRQTRRLGCRASVRRVPRAYGRSFPGIAPHEFSARRSA
jgi:hypothetical protein